jgi:fluoride ion exporter CrcB/FEX
LAWSRCCCWSGWRPTRYLRPLLGIGFFGAYTTFSTFTFETVRLLEDGAWRYAAWNLLLSAAKLRGALAAFLAAR